MAAVRMFLLKFGTEVVPKSLSVLGADRTRLTEPIFGALVETTDGLVLLDTGIGRSALADTATMTAMYGGTIPTGPEGDPLAVALAAVDLTVADIGLAVVSHLHVDHTGGIPLLAAAGVPVAIQGPELDYGRHRAEQGTELAAAFYRSDFLDPAINWHRLDGEAEIAPGVSVIPTPGHTPGHQSFRVDLPGTGTWILTADATDLAQNLHERVPCGWSAEPDDAARAVTSLSTLLDLAERTDARMLPGHDPIVWKAAGHPPGGHR